MLRVASPATRPDRAAGAGLVSRAPALLRVQRSAGNAAATAYVQRDRTVQRQATTLAPDQLTSAQRTAYAQFTPALIQRLRARLGLPDGGADQTLVQAVAQAQAGLPGPHRLEPDGIADGRLLARLFPHGLSTAAITTAFDRDMRTDVIGTWAANRNAEARMLAIVRVANRTLAAAGVPPVSPVIVLEAPVAAAFDPPSWSVQIGPELLAGRRAPTDARHLVEVVHHELRHAEQAFLAYRVLLGRHPDGPARTAAADRLDVPGRIRTALVAAAPPLAGSVLDVVGSAWLTSIDDRDPELVRLRERLYEAAERRRRAAERRRVRPGAASERAWRAANEDVVTLRERYYTLDPAEYDADTVGTAAGMLLDR